MRVLVAIAAICRSYVGKFLTGAVARAANSDERMTLGTIDFDMLARQLVFSAIMIKAGSWFPALHGMTTIAI